MYLNVWRYQICLGYKNNTQATITFYENEVQRKKFQWVSPQKIKILLGYLLLQKPRSRHHFDFDLV